MTTDTLSPEDMTQGWREHWVPYKWRICLRQRSTRAMIYHNFPITPLQELPNVR